MHSTGLCRLQTSTPRERVIHEWYNLIGIHMSQVIHVWVMRGGEAGGHFSRALLFQKGIVYTYSVTPIELNMSQRTPCRDTYEPSRIWLIHAAEEGLQIIATSTPHTPTSTRSNTQAHARTHTSTYLHTNPHSTTVMASWEALLSNTGSASELG